MDRPYNHEALKNTMRQIWRPGKPIKFHEVGARIMMVEFEENRDKERALRESPWNFDKCLLLLKDFKGLQYVGKLHFTEASFYIRVHDLPFMA